MSETSTGLPPVYMAIPVRQRYGRTWEERLNNGLSVEETQPLTNAHHQIVEWQEERGAAGDVLGFAAFLGGLIGLVLFVVSKFAQHGTTGPTSWDIGYWVAFALAACGFLFSGIHSGHLGKKIDRCTEDLITIAEPLKDHLIEVTHYDEQVYSLADELERARTQVLKTLAPDTFLNALDSLGLVEAKYFDQAKELDRARTRADLEMQTAFLDALKALAKFAEHTNVRPDLDLTRVASARHLYDDPAVKAVADEQKAATAAKTAAYIEARKAAEEFTRLAEDAETLRIAHTANNKVKE